MLAHRLRPWFSCKTALAKGLIFAGNTSTRYPDTMLAQCWNSVIVDGTTFNQHWVSASQKEAVTSAERKYILDLQVSKYGLLAALWQEETSIPCLLTLHRQTKC